MRRAIVTYAADAHEELLDISLPVYKEFARLHGYDMIVGDKMTNMPPAWNKVPVLEEVLKHYDVAVWFDCDLVVVDMSEDLPQDWLNDYCDHSMVRHFEDHSEVPNSGVWQVSQRIVPLLQEMTKLEVFRDHGWWEQAALMTLMGYTVPPQGSHFPNTRCRCVQQTYWYKSCRFMRLPWNSHPNYRADKPRIVHCSYPNMLQRIEVMRALIKDPAYDYPRYEKDARKGGKA